MNCHSKLLPLCSQELNSNSNSNSKFCVPQPQLLRKSASLYYIKLDFAKCSSRILSKLSTAHINSRNELSVTASSSQVPSNTILYKLGFTTTTLHERIFGKYNYRTKKWYHYGLGLPVGTSVTVISCLPFAAASEAYLYEQYYHTLHHTSRNFQLNVLANGNTELYGTDILQLDTRLTSPLTSKEKFQLKNVNFIK